MAPVSALKPIANARWWIGLWILAVVIVWIGCLASLDGVTVPGSDKWQHVTAYFLLAFSGVQLWQGRPALIRLVLGLLLMGAAIEVAQGSFTAGRQADPGDMLANALGVALGMALSATPLGNLLSRFQPARD